MTSISSGEIIYNQGVGWPRDRPSVTRPPSERFDRAAPTFPAQAKAGRALHGGLLQAIESPLPSLLLFSQRLTATTSSTNDIRHNFSEHAVQRTDHLAS